MHGGSSFFKVSMQMANRLNLCRCGKRRGHKKEDLDKQKLGTSKEQKEGYGVSYDKGEGKGS